MTNRSEKTSPPASPTGAPAVQQSSPVDPLAPAREGAKKKDVLSLLAEPGRFERMLEQMLKDHPKLTREQALADLKAAGW